MIQDYSEEETEIRRAMLQHARTKVFMCDESKFMCKSVFNVIGLDKVDAIVTDVPLPSLLEDYRDKNIHL